MTARLTSLYAEDREKAWPYTDVSCLRGQDAGHPLPALHENTARKA